MNKNSKKSNNYIAPMYYKKTSNTEIPEHEFVRQIVSTIRGSFISHSSNPKILENNLLVLHLCRDIIISHNFNDYCVDMIHDALVDTRTINGHSHKCISKQQLRWIFSQLRYIYTNAIPYKHIDNINQSSINYSIFDIALFGLYINGTGHKSRSQFYNTLTDKLNDFKHNNIRLTIIDTIHKRAIEYLRMLDIDHDYYYDTETIPQQQTLFSDIESTSCCKCNNTCRCNNSKIKQTIKNENNDIDKSLDILCKKIKKEIINFMYKQII